MIYRTSAVEYLSQSKQLIDERFSPTDAPSPPANEFHQPGAVDCGDESLSAR
jgi:hypothetical protein